MKKKKFKGAVGYIKKTKKGMIETWSDGKKIFMRKIGKKRRK